MKLKKTMRETPNLLLVFVFKLFSSFSSALLHGSKLVLDSLKAFHHEGKLGVVFYCCFTPFFSSSSVLLNGLKLLSKVSRGTTIKIEYRVSQLSKRKRQSVEPGWIVLTR